MASLVKIKFVLHPDIKIQRNQLLCFFGTLDKVDGGCRFDYIQPFLLEAPTHRHRHSQQLVCELGAAVVGSFFKLLIATDLESPVGKTIEDVLLPAVLCGQHTNQQIMARLNDSRVFVMYDNALASDGRRCTSHNNQIPARDSSVWEVTGQEFNPQLVFSMGLNSAILASSATMCPKTHPIAQAFLPFHQPLPPSPPRPATTRIVPRVKFDYNEDEAYTDKDQDDDDSYDDDDDDDNDQNSVNVNDTDFNYNNDNNNNIANVSALMLIRMGICQLYADLVKLVKHKLLMHATNHKMRPTSLSRRRHRRRCHNNRIPES